MGITSSVNKKVSTSSTAMTSTTAVIHPLPIWKTRLQSVLLRIYDLSGEIHSQAESLFQLGNLYFTGKAPLLSKDYEKALYYYRRASILHHGMATAYLGVMHHFGIGLPHDGPNPLRAARYYTQAFQSPDWSTSNHPQANQMKMFIQSMQTALNMKSYTFFDPVNYGLEQLIKTLWEVE
jgi:hypothetical protein